MKTNKLQLSYKYLCESLHLSVIMGFIMIESGREDSKTQN